jgi:uncharacterized protein YutE (UPF0331/DUF86 family)
MNGRRIGSLIKPSTSRKPSTTYHGNREREEYLNDWEQQAVVERAFQTAIEACLDIAELLLKELDEDIPPTNAEKFARLDERGVLSPETTTQMQAAAGFRNVLAHNYGHDIDDELVYMHLQENIHWFPRFLGEIREYLEAD